MSQVVNFNSYGSADVNAGIWHTLGVYRPNQPHYQLPASLLANPFKRQTYGGQRGCTLAPLSPLAVAAHPG